MSRLSPLGSPLLLGFGEIERFLDQAGKSAGDGYPPYNIERRTSEDDGTVHLRITLAVAGFRAEQLDITLEAGQLTVAGHQRDEETHEFLHQGIAARRFQRSFVLANGLKITRADLENGLLTINLKCPPLRHEVKRIKINDLG